VSPSLEGIKNHGDVALKDVGNIGGRWADGLGGPRVLYQP